jgi:ATP-binding cassette subfamily F protein 3
VILISHDRAFLAGTATRIWSWVDGRFEDYPGTFEEWQEWSERRRREVAAAASPAPRPQPAARPDSATAKPSLSKNEIRRLQTELERVESRIHEIESRTAEIEASLGDSALYSAGADPAAARALAAERDTLATELADAYAAWERLGEQLAGV